MKKSFNPTDIPQKEGQEEPKKLYRAISEQSKRLDDARGCAQKVADLFTPILKVHRKKFREYCERLIFSDPVLYGRKGEELLWRKSYYDVVATAKRLKKQEYTPDEICNIEAHINAGIGFYHHFVSKLRWDYDLELNGVVDFVTSNAYVNLNCTEKKVLEWAYLSVHQSLIYLGDLCRYKLEIYPNWDPNLAIRYYSQALYLKPDLGMPHNQMGTLASNQNRILDAVYHYMHCLACKVSFEGTENNLQRLFEKSSQFLEKLPNDTQNSNSFTHLDKIDHIKQFIARFLLLIDIWYFNKSVPHIYNLCHQTYIDLEECLSYFKPLTSESGDTQTEDSVDTDSSTPGYLSNDVVFKLIVVCLLCVSKLQKVQSHQLSTAVAFTLAIYSQLIQNVTSHIQQSVLSFPIPDVTYDSDAKRKQKLKKRRRRKSINESDDSEQSEPESADVCSSDESVASEEHVLSSSDEDELVKDAKPDIKTQKQNDETKTTLEIIAKSKQINASDMLEIISEEGLLQSIKILNDWLLGDADVLKSCAKNTRSLLRQITILVNLLNVNLKSLKLDGCKVDLDKVVENQERQPLPEDVVLKGVDILEVGQRKVDWGLFGKNCLSVKEEAVLRVVKLVNFGKYLTTLNESGVTYDEKMKIFECESQEEEDVSKVPLLSVEEIEKQHEENGEIIINNTDGKEFESKGQMIKMKHMGQLWLAAEVRALESRVRGKASLSPFLVLDCDALIKYTFMVKHLVNSRKFIVLVPSAVVSALDDLKREKSEARDAIRWLESQFHQGNRFFRAQRPHERASLPFIKYPKKKDKEAFIYIQIIECCHYLAQQQKGASNLVTLLIGNQNALSNGENREISYVGLAQSAGVELELITQFYMKWKKTAKGKR